MGARVTAKSGFDLDYVWRGAGQEREATAGGYYINASAAGEAPGRWFGPGAAALGLATGQTVERGAYDAVYGQVHPATGEKLGRAPAGKAKYEAKLAALLAAEPHATADRVTELRAEAHRLTRQSAPYTDVTVSFSKSISVLHASIRENARRARMAGDAEQEAYWEGREQAFQAVLHEANRAMLSHAQQWAGFTRVAYSGSKVDGQEVGRFAAAGIVATSWLQGTSRDGDPQDHIHNQIARMVRTDADGKWRALDTVALRGQLDALQAIASAHAEAGLLREFGVAWIPRADGAGNEIRGITQTQMDGYSQRTVAIKEATPAAVESWTARYGREPNARELLHIQQLVTMLTRKGKEDAQIDWDEYARKWDAQLGGELAQIAPSVSNLGRGGAAPAPGGPEPGGGEPLTSAEVQRERAAQQGLAMVQAASSTWTQAELTRHIGMALPAEARPADPDAAVALLHELTGRALAGAFGDVISLEAPQWPALPERLVRELDGRSVYTRPGTQRYATRVQLTVEERLLAQAQRQGAPRLAREACAAQLGADADALDAQLLARAREARAQVDLAGSGLRMDQAAALHHVLTSARLAEVLVGPAGSGKTRTLAEAARAWIGGGMGDVIGLATSQAARNVLAGAGVQLAENTSVFLGHSPAERGALGVRHHLRPGSLIVIDEASMMSVADLADLMDYAAGRGCKVVIAGDQEQLTAVEGGGGMLLLARELGHVQLAEAVRFREQWERDASLRLRAGDVSALAEYDSHGRIRGGDAEEVYEAARRMFVSHYVRNVDVKLIAAQRSVCRELSRRVRDDLLHLGLVERGREVELAEGAKASAGDLIICRKNDHRLKAGSRRRTLANGDVMRIEAIGDDGSLTVRLALDRDPETGGQRWAGRTFTYTRSAGSWGSGYASADLAYAETAHTCQGRTVSVGLPVVTGGESRQWFYSSMTRGAEQNVAHVLTRPAEVPDPTPRTRPAPELARHERLTAEREGLPAPPAAHVPPPDPRDAAAVLADVLARDDSEVSATETRRRGLANADHLARLNAMWQGETRDAHAERYRRAIAAELPAGAAAQLGTRQATWLWRTMRAAELAGLDPAEVAARAIRGRPMTGARDIPSVIDARIRRELGTLPPAALRAWSEQVPEMDDPRMQQFLRELAAAMDERKERIGEHLVQHPEAWSAAALGPVPDEPLQRLEWQLRAAHIGAYREMYNWDHDTEAIGPEPTGDSPEKRAAWHMAWRSMNRNAELDLRDRPDGSLHLMRGTYRAETEWAPRHVGAELRQVRLAAADADVAAARADAEVLAAREAGDEERAGRHEGLARSWRAAGAFYSQRAEIDAAQMDDRAEYERLTDDSRRAAVAADAELRRRHPGEFLEPLTSAEPDEAEDTLPEVPALGAEAEEALAKVAQQRARFRERVEARQGVMVPAEDPDMEPEGEAWPAWPGLDRDAVLQPPKPDLRPAAAVLEAAGELEAGR